MSDTPTALAGRSVLVMGLGCFGGGLGATRFLLKAGARVTVTDLRSALELEQGLAGLDAEVRLGEHRIDDFLAADIVVPNPAVSPDNEFLRAARENGAKILSEIELFLERCPARIAAVTGTQGKSSTCAMLARLLECSGKRVHLGGNIGGSLLGELDSMTAEDVCVLELSSYQLEALSSPSANDAARVAGRAELVVITNILADHLERHGTIEAYAHAKLRILELMGASSCVLLPEGLRLPRNRPLPSGRQIRVGPTAELRIEAREFRFGGVSLGDVADFPLPGGFQLENALMALGAAHRMGASARALAEAIPTLVGLDHRLQDLGQIRGHRVWDNGVSTTPDSTASALQALAGDCVLVCGGRYKRTLPLDNLIDAARTRVRCAVTFGADAETLAASFRAAEIHTHITATLGDAVTAAFEEARADDAVLFSPACASFDAYKNFRERALEFRSLLRTAT